MKTKVELDETVAANLGLSRREVSDITFEFIESIRSLLVKEGIVAIPRLGSIRVFTWSVNRNRIPKSWKWQAVRGVITVQRIRVYFSKSPKLKEELRRAHGKARRR